MEKRGKGKKREESRRERDRERENIPNKFEMVSAAHLCLGSANSCSTDSLSALVKASKEK